MTTCPVSISRQRQAVELALSFARSATPKSYRMTESGLDMLRSDLAAAIETLRKIESDEYAKQVLG